VTEDEQKAFLAAGLSQPNVWLTGLPLMDSVFSGEMRRRQLSDSRRDSRKQVLYMPDWRRAISAAPAMKEALSTLCEARDGALDIVIRPNPVTLESQPGWIEGWINLAASFENLTVHVAAGVDYLSLMADADLLLSDFSTPAFTFLAFDAPLVLIRPDEGVPQQYRVSERHGELLENVARCTDGGTDVVAQVLKSLDGTDHGDESRARMRSGVFGGGADGRAAGRTVSALRGFLDA